MTELEWRASDDPMAMLAWLTATAGPSGHYVRHDRPISDRKLQLFVQGHDCPECRDVWGDDTREWRATYLARASCGTGADKAALLREIVGNPFRLRPAARAPGGLTVAGWLTGDAVAIARHAYDAQDWAALPVLADALEEAGCDSKDLLCHLRGLEQCPNGNACTSDECLEGDGWISLRGPHVRGCWALDLVLGKE